MKSKLLNIFGVLLTVVCVLSNELDISKEMEWKSYDIVPNVIDIAPKTILKVTYKSGAQVNFGNELTPTQVKDIPEISWESESDAFYTLSMCDPDAPSRENPIVGEVRHWLVVNIPGNNIFKGTNLFEFVGSGPPSGSGLHRYIFLVFKQTKEISTENLKVVSNRSREGRLSTRVRNLITEFNLEPSPIAGNFYQAQYDDYVPIVHKQLGGEPPIPQK